MLNKSIETAQKRIEQRNAAIRKHTLEYDDVMNKQRQEIYTFRNELLHADNVEPLVVELLEIVCTNIAEKHFRNRNEENGWDPEGFRQALISRFPVNFPEGYFENDHIDITEIEAMASEKIVQAFKEKLARENNKVPRAQKELSTTFSPANEAVRNLMIRKVDQSWQEHLLRMDHLRSDVNLRTVGQRDPLMEFKHEAFELFDEFSRNVRTEIAQDLFRFEIITRQIPTLQEMLASLQLETKRSFIPEGEQQVQPTAQINRSEEEAIDRPNEKLQPITVGPRTTRNELCPCGSGKKYKKCCGAQSEEDI